MANQAHPRLHRDSVWRGKLIVYMPCHQREAIDDCTNARQEAARNGKYRDVSYLVGSYCSDVNFATPICRILSSSPLMLARIIDGEYRGISYNRAETDTCRRPVTITID
jgi:hypothetical protein